MLNFLKPIIFLAIFTIILSGCSHSSFKEENSKTIKTVSSIFKEKPKKTNTNSEDIRFYLPYGYQIKGESPNNIILKNGSKTYILFHNPEEDLSSPTVYKATLSQYPEAKTNKTLKGNHRFGYLLIEKMKDDMNEMTVGIGGTKITTQTKTDNLHTDAKAMMQIINSVESKK